MNVWNFEFLKFRYMCLFRSLMETKSKTKNVKRTWSRTWTSTTWNGNGNNKGIETDTCERKQKTRQHMSTTWKPKWQKTSSTNSGNWDRIPHPRARYRQPNSGQGVTLPADALELRGALVGAGRARWHRECSPLVSLADACQGICRGPDSGPEWYSREPIAAEHVPEYEWVAITNG